jgi:hypothetical protein
VVISELSQCLFFGNAPASDRLRHPFDEADDVLDAMVPGVNGFFRRHREGHLPRDVQADRTGPREEGEIRLAWCRSVGLDEVDTPELQEIRCRTTLSSLEPTNRS